MHLHAFGLVFNYKWFNYNAWYKHGDIVSCGCDQTFDLDAFVTSFLYRKSSWQPNIASVANPVTLSAVKPRDSSAKLWSKTGFFPAISPLQSQTIKNLSFVKQVLDFIQNSSTENTFKKSKALYPALSVVL